MQFILPYHRLVFTRADVTIFEAKDYPDDLPYVAVQARELPLLFDFDEAVRLGRGLSEWALEHATRAARERREHERHVRALAALADSPSFDPGPLVRDDTEARTTLELIQLAEQFGRGGQK